MIKKNIRLKLKWTKITVTAEYSILNIKEAKNKIHV